ncbi:MAG: pyridoxine 5'-phosphate synthase [Candidatus Latescibacterota bacterium]
MAYLSVNVDYVAYIRQARRTVEPDPVLAAGIIEMAGAHGITAHLREDRRHILDRDIRLLREVVRLPFNLEMAPTEEMVSIARETLPDQVTLVPEKREEITTEGGLDVIGNRDKVQRALGMLKEKGIKTSLFIDPDPRQIAASKDAGSDCVELHTGEYANAVQGKADFERLDELRINAALAKKIGLEVHAGHGLTYKNIVPVARIEAIEGFYIGHSIMARAIYVGLDRAVKDMVHLIHNR